MKQFIITLHILLLAQFVFGQKFMGKQQPVDNNYIVFKDTIGCFVVDSLVSHCGEMPQTIDKIVKYFKYIGNDPVVITNTWTNDPHYICDYPKEPLIKNKVYTFSVCFYNISRRGDFYKNMGFALSNGQGIKFTFIGTVKPEE